jgi:hypothetical protein
MYMKKVVIGIILIILILILAGGFVIASKPDKMTEEEKQKAVAEMLGRKVKTGSEIKTGDTTYRGKFAQFSYPAAAKIYTYKGEDMKNNDTQAESFSFDLQSPRRVFYYTTTKLDTGQSKLEDIPAVNFRKNSANGYTVKEEKVDGVSGLSFSKDKSGEYMAEKTGYFIMNGNVVSISITGTTLDDTSRLYDEITKSMIFTN